MAALAVVFTPRAARQVEAAFAWWTHNRTASQPTMGLPLAGSHRGVRRVHLIRVGYNVYYRVAPRLAQLQVLAFWHSRRGSSPL